MKPGNSEPIMRKTAKYVVHKKRIGKEKCGKKRNNVLEEHQEIIIHKYNTILFFTPAVNKFRLNIITNIQNPFLSSKKPRQIT